MHLVAGIVFSDNDLDRNRRAGFILNLPPSSESPAALFSWRWWWGGVSDTRLDSPLSNDGSTPLETLRQLAGANPVRHPLGSVAQSARRATM